VLQSKSAVSVQNPLTVVLAPLAKAVLTIGPIIWSVLLAACFLDSLGPPDRDPTITGVITNVETDGSSLRILIEEYPDMPVDGDPNIVGQKMFLSVDGTLVFVQRDNGSWYLGTKEDLSVGSTARAWASNILDTYPGRGIAEHIAVLSTPSQ
jgi:hypothetical protein